MPITVLSRKTGDIPVLEVFSEGLKEPGPLILLQHGWTSRKEDMLPSARVLAEKGFFVVLPDALGHGERKSGDYAAGGGAVDGLSETIRGLLQICRETAAEFNLLIDYYSENPLVDKDRIGVAGASMGGLIVFEFLFKHGSGLGSRLKAAVPLISTPCPDMLTGPEEVGRLNAHFHFFEGEPEAGEYDKAVALIKDYMRDNHYGILDRVPLLMLNGGQDPIFPEGVVKKAAELLCAGLEASRQPSLIVYPEAAHDVTARMNEEMARWFLKWMPFSSHKSGQIQE